MEWSHDGRAIATGWSKGGMCIWSFYGCRLFCSVTALSYQQHQQKKKQQQQGRGSEEGEEEEEKTSQQALGFLQGGIASLCWTSSSYSILIAEEGKENQVVNIDFVKSAVDSTSSMVHHTHTHKTIPKNSLFYLTITTALEPCDRYDGTEHPVGPVAQVQDLA